MSIRTVAIDRDVRAPVGPSVASLFSDAAQRRALRVTALVIIDSLCLVAGILIASYVAKGPWPLLWPSLSWWDVGLQAGALVCVAALEGLYGRRLARHSVRKILSAWVIAFIVTLALALLLDQETIGARYVAAWIVAVALDLGARAVYDALSGLFPHRDQGPAALLIGSPESCRAGIAALRSLPPAGQVVVEGLLLVDDAPAPRGDDQLPDVLGTDRDLARALTLTGATQVIIADPAELNGHLRSVMALCSERGVALNVVAPGLPVTEPVAYIPGLDCPLFVVIPQPAGAASYLAKAVLDRVLSAVLLVVLSPFLLAIAVAIRLTSPGPVLFTDERVGVGQQPFPCYKFRTMVRDARESQARARGAERSRRRALQAPRRPTRHARGQVPAATSLDELPQLWNVLKGDMSLVGPRPLPLRDCGLMEDSHRRRHVVKPGMTGLWQVSGRSHLGFDDMVRLDLQYMETWSLKSDAYIIVAHARRASCARARTERIRGGGHDHIGRHGGRRVPRIASLRVPARARGNASSAWTTSTRARCENIEHIRDGAFEFRNVDVHRAHRHRRAGRLRLPPREPREPHRLPAPAPAHPQGRLLRHAQRPGPRQVQARPLPALLDLARCTATRWCTRSRRATGATSTPSVRAACTTRPSATREALTMAYHRQQGVDTCIARIFNTYGPRMRPNDGRAVPTFIAPGARRRAAHRVRRRHPDAVVLLRRRPRSRASTSLATQRRPRAR